VSGTGDPGNQTPLRQDGYFARLVRDIRENPAIAAIAATVTLVAAFAAAVATVSVVKALRSERPASVQSQDPFGSVDSTPTDPLGTPCPTIDNAKSLPMGFSASKHDGKVEIWTNDPALPKTDITMEFDPATKNYRVVANSAKSVDIDVIATFVDPVEGASFNKSLGGDTGKHLDLSVSTNPDPDLDSVLTCTGPDGTSARLVAVGFEVGNNDTRAGSVVTKVSNSGIDLLD
jgi:hypothetical protein